MYHPLNSFLFCYHQLEWEELPHMHTWDLTIFWNTIGNKDKGEVIPCTWFHSFFSRKKSEIQIAFTFFEKWKVKNKIPSLFFEKWKWNWNGSRSRTRSENEKKNLENSRETRISLVSVSWVHYQSRLAFEHFVIAWSLVRPPSIFTACGATAMFP